LEDLGGDIKDIKIDVQGTGFEGVDWIHMAQDKNQ
jgi:hypothetical protein